ncbi:hypothetical protein F2P81_016509 [Scophthalmus maximus]|uniref:Reverse transcriptase domain-containing protein n=1 Tax=Scophthalmus maximus TaxID=52904 RepID=A0A6A4SLN5_SCOMX|nr:hypothetical protein F2P81_016509 [Scophthalmus maximus]
MSPLLFAIAIEHLSIALKCSSCFTGVFRAGLEHQVSLYADDLLLYITDPVSCVDNILQILATFGSFSGYKLNISKSECFPELSTVGTEEVIIPELMGATYMPKSVVVCPQMVKKKKKAFQHTGKVRVEDGNKFCSIPTR